uniref:ADGRF3/5-like N-terminal domain-containing protein n=1 Tax=Tetraodon nigroviridis TaxID=99883 RepID=H3C4K8_TETNG
QHCHPKTVPTSVYEYEVIIEVNTTDVDHLRNTLRNVAFPASVGPLTNISHAIITTVCRSDAGTVQCRCEDGHLWPCDKCAMYGRCDNDTNTCRCIRGFPTNGQLCQSIHSQNFSTCPSPTASPVLYEYMISVELNFSDAAALNQLKTVLNRTAYPIRLNGSIDVSGINFTTVCSENGGSFQCRCENLHRWSCDQCLKYGPCDAITNDSCTCITSFPLDGQYCQPVDQQNFAACPSTTVSPST